jgi:hypothetical protein
LQDQKKLEEALNFESAELEAAASISDLTDAISIGAKSL